MNPAKPRIEMALLRELCRHMEWADATVWRALLTYAPAERDGRLRQLLFHLHGVQLAFLGVWTAQPWPQPPADDVPLSAIPSKVAQYHADLGAALGTFDDAALLRPVRMPGLEPYEEQLGRTFDNPTLAETILQVTSHSTYHRGQVNARLREIGGEPPLVDYIAWIWFGRPAAEWPAAQAQ